jgi:hypothetical protein
MEAVSSEMLVPSYHTAWYYDPEDRNININVNEIVLEQRFSTGVAAHWCDAKGLQVCHRSSGEARKN